MKKAINGHGIDWIEVVIPPETKDDEPYTITLNLTFMLSNWECIFGRGCSGLFGAHHEVTNPDVGCCTGSFHFYDRDDRERIAALVPELTSEDWDDELRARVEKHGWERIFKDKPPQTEDDEDEFEGKGRVFEGACVFANRSTGSVGSKGKLGCAFVHMGNRKGQPDHIDTMPFVCWQLPLRLHEDDSGNQILTAWDASEWSQDPDDRYEDMRGHCNWWCIDSPEAYIGESMVWKTMEREIRRVIGDRQYELVDATIKERLDRGNTYAPMPGAVVNDGRPLLPLLVGNRKPRRPYPEFENRLDEYRRQAES